MGMARSTNRKNRVLRAPATTDSCEIGAGDPEGSPFAFWEPFRKDRVLRLRDLNLLGNIRTVVGWREERRHLANYQNALTGNATMQHRRATDAHLRPDKPCGATGKFIDCSQPVAVS